MKALRKVFYEIYSSAIRNETEFLSFIDGMVRSIPIIEERSPEYAAIIKECLKEEEAPSFTLEEVIPDENLIIKLKDANAFDPIYYDIVPSFKTYLEENPEGIGIIPTCEKSLFCYGRDSIKQLYANMDDNWFYECNGKMIGNTSHKQMKVDMSVAYVGLPMDCTGMKAFIDSSVVKAMLEHPGRLFVIEPVMDQGGVQKSITHTASHKNAIGGPRANYVSANHCQAGSNILVYTIKVVQVTSNLLAQLGGGLSLRQRHINSINSKSQAKRKPKSNLNQLREARRVKTNYHHTDKQGIKRVVYTRGQKHYVKKMSEGKYKYVQVKV